MEELNDLCPFWFAFIFGAGEEQEGPLMPHRISDKGQEAKSPFLY